MDKITKSVVGKGEPTPDPAPMTDKTMREKIAEGLHKERRRNPLPVPVGLDKTGYWLTYADAILALKVAGVPLSELIDKAKSGKLVELAED